MFVVVVTASDGQQFAREKYFTGRFEGRWPEYSLNPERAAKFGLRATASSVVSQLADRKFTAEIRPA